MDYITEIFKGVNTQDICEFLLNGVESVEHKTNSYKERLDKSCSEVNKMICAKFPDIDENEAIMQKILAYACETEHVYMEIGLKCGFSLATQHLPNIQE